MAHFKISCAPICGGTHAASKVICDSFLKETFQPVHAEQRDELPLLTLPVNENNQIQTGAGWSAADRQESGCKATVLQGGIPAEAQPSN